VLNRFELHTDATCILYPDRFQDSRGVQMWDRVIKLIAKRVADKERVAAAA